MQRSDVMIGDLYVSPTGRFCYVTMCDFPNDKAWWADCKPVPVSVTMITSLGFKVMKGGDDRFTCYKLKAFYLIHDSSDDKFFFSDSNIEVEYAHQLQQLLRLAGEKGLAQQLSDSYVG